MDDPGLSKAKRKREYNDEDEDEDDVYSHDEGGFMDDESEPHKFGHTVLPVANLPNSFDGVPQDGMEYLFTVRREQRRLPIVTRVHNPYAIQEEVQLAFGIDGADGANASLSVIPSEEWRVCFEERFRNLRANMQQPTINITIPDPSAAKLPEMRDRDRWWAFFRGDVEWEDIPSSKSHGWNAEGTARRYRGRETVDYEEALPPDGSKMRSWIVYEEKLSWDQTEEDGVVALSYGGENAEPVEVEEGECATEDPEQPDQELAAATLRKGKQDEEVAPLTLLGSIDPTAVPPATSSVICPREPTPHLLSLLDQKTTFHLLKYFSQWIQGHFERYFLPKPPPRPGLYGDSGTRLYNFTPTHARWIFALLSRLDTCLTSDEISVLRKLAREIMRLIKEERSYSSAPHWNRTSVPGMGETACWLVVAAIVGEWGQKDLWMDAADTLR